VVRAEELSAAAVVGAMDRGDFYFSTGVTLSKVQYDPREKTLTVAVKSEPATKYTIEFRGTLAGADPTGRVIEPPNPKDRLPRAIRQYSPEIGKILAVSEAEEAVYKLTGRELYVRAVVRSDKPRANPIAAEAKCPQEAWTQPVGWESRLAERPKE
jgi:hypothetical protein